MARHHRRFALGNKIRQLIRIRLQFDPRDDSEIWGKPDLEHVNGSDIDPDTVYAAVTGEALGRLEEIHALLQENEPDVQLRSFGRLAHASNSMTEDHLYGDKGPALRGLFVFARDHNVAVGVSLLFNEKAPRLRVLIDPSQPFSTPFLKDI